jgi:4-carboxymuconolactone decarboxylase
MSSQPGSDASEAVAAFARSVPPQRLAPVGPDERAPEVAQLLDGLKLGRDGEVLNLFSTLAHHPALLKRFVSFGGTLLMAGELPARDRELLILRTAWNCRAPYEWAPHGDLARMADLDDGESARVADGPDAAGWNEEDAALLRAADELHESARIGDTTWEALAARYTEAQLIEVCMLVGQYHLVAFTLNSLGVQLEDSYPQDTP